MRAQTIKSTINTAQINLTKKKKKVVNERVLVGQYEYVFFLLYS